MRSLFLLCLAGATAAAAAATAPQPETRIVLPFQYAWRFHYGDDPSSPPGSGPGSCNTAFDVDLQDRPICEGMERNPNRFSEKDCRIACCYDPNCYAWQAYPLALGRACFHGYGPNISCPKGGANKSGLGGGLRHKPPNPAFRTDYHFAVDSTPTTGPDTAWELVDAPHDFISERANFTNDVTNFKQGYLPRNASWYRKYFDLPSYWQNDGGQTYVHFEGVFHHTTIFLNGHYVMSHECGYTSFSVRLDNATGVRFGSQGTNVLALRTDASFGSGHWYEGGGIYRPVQLVHVQPAHITVDGLFVPPEWDGKSVHASAEVEMTGEGSMPCKVRFSLLDGDRIIAQNMSTTAAVCAAKGPAVLQATLHPPAGVVQPWDVRSPNLYVVRAEVLTGSPATVSDAVEETVGFRSTHWSGTSGFYLNSANFDLRGFSHHNSIGGLGVAIPERVHLFRVQASRALGANIWRMSHNPYVPSLYKLLDITGTMCWDENRDYGAKYMGGAYATAMRDMVKRDRNHPSIIIWSFCNEYECQQNDANFSALAFRAAAESVDRTRPLTGNDATYGDPSALDVQGFSHSKNVTFDKFHQMMPQQPTVLSECCSCDSQRPDRTLPDCIAVENSPGINNEFVSGSLGVWTLMDYFGEPHGTGTSAWPYVSSDFGQFDIAGFPKSHAYWYSVNWLQKLDPSSAGRPPLSASPVVRILSLGEGIQATGAVNTVTSAPYSELFLDGKSLGVRATPVDMFGNIEGMNWTLSGSNDKCYFPGDVSGVQCLGLKFQTAVASAEECQASCCAQSQSHCTTWQFDTTSGGRGCWAGIPTECTASRQGLWTGKQRPLVSFQNITLVARTTPTGEIIGRHCIGSSSTANASFRLELTVDCPSASTGTGDALYLDGRDMAMVRATIVDVSRPLSPVVAHATNRIHWRVVSGPGRAVGVSNGDPSSHEWMKSSSVNAWGGLARGFFKVTEDCITRNVSLVKSIDVDSEKSKTRVSSVTDCTLDDIVIEATADGVQGGPVRISIPVSVSPADHPFKVAEKTTKAQSTFTYMSDFKG